MIAVFAGVSELEALRRGTDVASVKAI